jgi:hypothetical protein
VQVADSNSQLWIVLRKSEKPDGTTDFKQDGPYSTEEVQQLMSRGILRSSDFVWKKGAEAWIPVTDVDEFNLMNLKEQPVVKSDLSRVVEFGNDLPPVTNKKNWKSLFQFNKVNPFYFSALLLPALFIVGYKLLPHKQADPSMPVASEIAKAPAPTVAPSRELSAQKPAQNAEQPELENNNPTPAASQTVPQVTSKLSVKTMGRDFVVNGPFSIGQKIEVTLRGKTGDVLEVPALYLRLQLTSKKNGELFVSHKNYQIPQGRFELKVVMGAGKEGSFKITLSEGTTDLDSALKKHRKKIAFDQQTEKKNLIKFIQRIEKQPTLASSTKGLPKELQWVQQDRNYLVFRTDWIKLQKILSTTGRAPASVGAKESLRSLKKLKSEIQLKSSSINPN